MNGNDLSAINKSNRGKPVKFETMYIFLYELIMVLGIIQTSMFRYSINTMLLIKIQLVIAAFLFIMSIVSQKLTLKDILLGITFVGGASINFIKTGYTVFILLGLIIFSMRRIRVRKLLFSTLIMLIITLSSIALLALIGKIPNLIIYRSGVARQSFGMIYPLSMSTYLFSIAVCISILFKRHKLWVSTALIFLGYLCYVKMGARNDTITILLLLLVVLFSSLLDKMNFLKGFLIPNVITIVSLLFIFLTILVPYGSTLYFKLNALLSGRMGLQDMLLNNYGIKLWGQHIVENGNGGFEGQNRILKYFYIDNSYNRVLFLGGLVIFIIFMVIIFLRIYSLSKNDFTVLALVFAIVCINGLTQESLQNPNLDVLVPIFLTPIMFFEERLI